MVLNLSINLLAWRVYCEIYIEENIWNVKLTHLILRGYPEQMVEKTLWEVTYKDRKEVLKQTYDNVQETCYHLWHNFNRLYQNLKSIITDKWHFLILREKFKEPSLICYRKVKLLKDMLVKAKQLCFQQ